MFKKYTYQQKFKVSIVLLVLLALATYKKTYRQIFRIHNELETMTQRINETGASNQEIYNINTQLNDLDVLIGRQGAEPEMIQHKMLDFITNSKLDVNVINIEKAHLFKGAEFMIYTNQIEVEGGYENLVKLLFQIESDFMISRVSNVKLYTVKDFRNKKKRLILKLILQNYEKI
jgi:hypothetical protein